MKRIFCALFVLLLTLSISYAEEISVGRYFKGSSYYLPTNPKSFVDPWMLIVWSSGSVDDNANPSPTNISATNGVTFTKAVLQDWFNKAYNYNQKTPSTGSPKYTTGGVTRREHLPDNLTYSSMKALSLRATGGSKAKKNGAEVLSGTQIINIIDIRVSGGDVYGKVYNTQNGSGSLKTSLGEQKLSDLTFYMSGTINVYADLDVSPPVVGTINTTVNNVPKTSVKPGEQVNVNWTTARE